LSREALVIVQFAGRPLLAQSGHSENLRCPFCADTVAKAEWISGALPNIGVQCGACAEEFEAIRAGNFRIDYLVVEPPVPPTSRALWKLPMCDLYSHHHQPSRDHRPVPRDQPLCRQPAADAGRVSRCSGPSKTWLKTKNPASAAVRREREEEWH
jgi:hypothetical protein